MPLEIDNYNKILQNTVDIYGSRESIRSQLSDFAKQYLELKDVDMYKTSFLSYIIDILSILTANQMFYTSTIYREFFLITSQFKESVLNLSRWIGYSPDKAIPSKVDVILTFPLTFPSPRVTFAIPSDFTLYSGDIPFLVDTNPVSNNAAVFKRHIDDEGKSKPIQSTPIAVAGVSIINNNAITVKDSNGFSRPVAYNSINNTVSFSLPFTQHKKVIKQFLIPSNLEFYQFYSTNLEFDGMYSDIKIYIREPVNGEQLSIVDEEKYVIISDDQESPEYRSYGYKASDIWTQSDSGIYTLSSNDKQYVWAATDDQGDLMFGNGVLGRQPMPGSKVLVILYITKGQDGEVLPGTITKGGNLYYTESNGMQRISYSTLNAAPSTGSKDSPTLSEIKHSAIVNLRSKKRLVSEMDYDDINEIMGPNFPVIEAQPILKRSDIKVNEIMTFMRLLYHDQDNMPEVVPTRNINFEIIDPPFVDGEYVLHRNSTITIDGNNYRTIFNIVLNQQTRVAQYDYILSRMYGTPAQLSQDQPFYEAQNYISDSYIPLRTIDFNIIDGSEDGSSSSMIESSYPLEIICNVSHTPSTEMKLFRLKIKTKWGSLNEYMNEIIPYTEDSKIPEPDGSGYIQKYLSFRLEIPNYRDIPTGIQRIEYVMEGYSELDDIWIPLQKYYTDVTIRQDLSDVMLSTVTNTRYWDGICHDDTMWTIHNVPCILSDYLDNGDGGGVYNNDNQKNFESAVIQNLIKNLQMSDKRMLTDFINVKFPDTHGKLYNLKYNPVDYTVNSLKETPFSSIMVDPPEPGTYFIVNGVVPGYESYNISSYINYIAEYNENHEWVLHKPEFETYIKVMDEFDTQHDESIYAYDGTNWINVQKFTIPLKIHAKIRISNNSAISDQGLINNVKEKLIEIFDRKMGMNQPIDRSEIIQTIRSVEFVNYCELVEPEINIRFRYDIKDLTQKQLLDYTPQYVGFIQDSIDIDIISTT